MSLTEKSKMTTSVISQKKIEFKMSLTEKSNNNDKMTTTMFMPDDLCGVINSYLKPEWKRFMVEIEYSYSFTGLQKPKIKYFIEADYMKAREYYEDEIEKLVDHGEDGYVTFQFQEYINGEWKFSQKHEDYYERIGKCECCESIGTVGRRHELKDAFCCDGCDNIYCWDCDDMNNGMRNGFWYCCDCADDFTDSEDEDEDTSTDEEED